MVHFGSFYKIPLFILFCGLQGCQYFGVGIIYFWAFDGIEIDLYGGFSIFRLVATFVMMTDTPVYHHYSVPTILQVVTRICFRKKLFYYRFQGEGLPKRTPSPHRISLHSNMEAQTYSPYPIFSCEKGCVQYRLERLNWSF